MKTIACPQGAVAVIEGGSIRIGDVSSALDLIGTASYEGCFGIAAPKEAFAEEFFRLGTGLAGEILQKFANYRMRLAIFGEFSQYASKPLHDFIYESNRGGHIFFLADEQSAVEALCKAGPA